MRFDLVPIKSGSSVSKIEDRNKKALAIKEKIAVDRSIGQIARDVHLTNVNLKRRSFQEQIEDRQFLQDCVACWDLLGVDNGERQQVEDILMERYWLIGD